MSAITVRGHFLMSCKVNDSHDRRYLFEKVNTFLYAGKRERGGREREGEREGRGERRGERE